MKGREDAAEASKATRLAASVGAIQSSQNKHAADKAAVEVDALHPLLQPAIQMYQSGATDKSWAFTKDHIKSILHFVFDCAPKKSSGKKSKWFKQLADLDRVDMDTDGQISRALALAPPLAVLQAAAAQVAAASASTPNEFWLYHQCEGAKATMESNLSLLDIAKVVLSTLQKIEAKMDQSDVYHAGGEYANYFFEAFSKEPKQDVSFVTDLTERVADLIDDPFLTEADLEKYQT